MGRDPCPEIIVAQANALPFRLAACQLFHLALLRSARVVARHLRLLRFDLLAGGSFAFLALFFT